MIPHAQPPTGSRVARTKEPLARRALGELINEQEAPAPATVAQRANMSTITLNAGSVVMQSLSPGTEHLPVVGGGETPHITDCEAIG
jgi:hypothetical protein